MIRVLLLSGVLLLTGCSREVTVSTVLAETGGLRPGDKVLLAEREVGTIETIETIEGVPGFVVSLGLYPEHVELVQANAVGYVPLDGPPRLLLVNPTAASAPVTAGDRLKGLSPLEIGMWRAGDAVDAATGLVSEFATRIDEYFEGEDWARTRAQIDAELAELAGESERAAQKLSSELGALFRAIQEEAAASAETLSDELAEIEREIEALEAEGHEDLAEAVRKLLRRIEELGREDAPVDPAREPRREGPDGLATAPS